MADQFKHTEVGLSVAWIDSWPHGISCAGCHEEQRCNVCGKQILNFSRTVCTNGRCTTCCNRNCHHGSGV